MLKWVRALNAKAISNQELAPLAGKPREKEAPTKGDRKEREVKKLTDQG